jgi:hypothetical protein
MSKYELKTKKNKKSVTAFVKGIEDTEKRKDAQELLKLFREVTGKRPVMWGDSIIGYDSYHYKYASGQEGDWMMTGFSPRKQNLSIYIVPGFDNQTSLLEKLGPHKTSVSCLYIKRLSDVHLPTLKKIIAKGYKEMKKQYS